MRDGMYKDWIDCKYDQLRLFKHAHDNGYLTKDIAAESDIVSEGESFFLEISILNFLEHLYDKISLICVEEGVDVLPERYQNMVKDYIMCEGRAIYLESKVVGRYFELIYKVKETISDKEFQRIVDSPLIKKYKAESLLDDIITGFCEAFSEHNVVDGVFQLVVIFGAHLDLEDIEVVKATYELIELAKEKIPRMEKFLSKFYCKAS